jgi:hemophore-related protein
MPLNAKLIASAGAGVTALMLGSGVAGAQPVDAIVNSTCSYGQVMSALQAQSPDVATQISNNFVVSGWLQQLVASPPDQRRLMVAQAQFVPGVPQYAPLIFQVANTCNSF